VFATRSDSVGLCPSWAAWVASRTSAAPPARIPRHPRLPQRQTMGGGVCGKVADVAGGALGAAVDPAVGDQAGADPGTDLDHDHVLHAAACPGAEFTQSHDVHVVVDPHRHPVPGGEPAADVASQARGQLNWRQTQWPYADPMWVLTSGAQTADRMFGVTLRGDRD
jgi:hypothetical protein